MVIDYIDPDYSLIESELEYNNYIATKVFFDELAVLSIKFSESSVILEADLKQSVMSYIRKIVANIQNAWNKFRNTITQSVWNTIKEKYKVELTMDRPFEITEVTSDGDVFVNWEKVDDLYSKMDHSTFLKIDLNSDEDIDEIKLFKTMMPINFEGMDLEKLSVGGVMKYITEKLDLFPKIKVDDVIDLKRVSEYQGKLDNINGKEMKYIEASLKSFNEMEKAIEAALRNHDNMVQAPKDNGTTVDTASAISSSSIYDTLLREATIYISEDIKGVDQNDPEGVEANGGNKSKTNLYKKTSKICKIYTMTLSVMMNVLSKANNKSISVILKYCRNASKYRKKENNEGEAKETPEDNSANTGNQISINSNT